MRTPRFTSACVHNAWRERPQLIISLHLNFGPVAQLIRETRLQACREALQNPRLRQRTILEIAGDWGFDDPSHFSRLYKLRFGRTPREDRLQPVQQAVAAALH